jgi:hypothetical protein
MANWNDIKSNVGRAANKAFKKAGELADVASLNFKLKSLKAKLSDRYEKLGRLTYKQLKTEISQAEAISEVIAEIDALREEGKELKQKIDEAKKEKENSAESVSMDEVPTGEVATETAEEAEEVEEEAEEKTEE